jgi:hypothetical protein
MCQYRFLSHPFISIIYNHSPIKKKGEFKNTISCFSLPQMILAALRNVADENNMNIASFAPRWSSLSFE